jgi:hypothetical protein
MGQKTGKQLLMESPRDFFYSRVEEAMQRLKIKALPHSQNYLVDLLAHYMFSHNLFPVDEESGKTKRETLAETYLKAQNSPAPVRLELLKRLGDSSLYVSGFFGDSLSRKVVDIDYYMNMGGTAYSALAHEASDEIIGAVYGEFSNRFAAFVDVLTFISQESLVQSNGDLLRLYDRYMSTGSKLAEEQLLEKGLLNADLSKTKIHKM